MPSLNPLALKLIAGLCAILLLVVLVQDRNRWKAKASSLQTTLNQISTKRDEQRKVSEKNVRGVVEGQERVITVVRTIREAPNPENCRTPALDQLRNEV